MADIRGIFSICSHKCCLVFYKRKPLGSQLFRDTMALCLFTFTVVLPIVCRNLRHTPYDVFFRGDESHEKDILVAENKKRGQHSIEILNTTFSSFIPRQINRHSRIFLNHNTSPSFDNSAVIEDSIAITIITVSRNKKLEDNYKPNYLVQSVAAFLQVINRTNNIPIHFSVCNVDKVPMSHIDMDYLPKWIPIFQRYQKADRSRLTYNDLLEKEKEDYVFCLEKALEQNMTFALLVEDDTLPLYDFFEVIKSKILSIKYRERQLNSLEKVLFVKLYHPERLLGFISLEHERLPELISLAMLLTGILICIYNRWRTNVSLGEKKLTCILFLYSMCVMLSIGRQNISQFRRFSKHFYQMTPAASCCTPAMLFPREGGTTVAGFLKTVKCRKGFGKDMAIAELVDRPGYKSKMIQPNLFEHIGLYSSLRSGFINPFMVQ